MHDLAGNRGRGDHERTREVDAPRAAPPWKIAVDRGDGDLVRPERHAWTGPNACAARRLDEEDSGFSKRVQVASFFGVLIFGRNRVPPLVYLFSTMMVALGTTFSAFWIMVNNSWMQAPAGYAIENGIFVPTDWKAIIFSPVVWVRFPHMLVAAYLTGAFCVAATGAWYRLRGTYAAEGRLMLRMGLFLAALLVPYCNVGGALLIGAVVATLGGIAVARPLLLLLGRWTLWFRATGTGALRRSWCPSASDVWKASTIKC